VQLWIPNLRDSTQTRYRPKQIKGHIEDYSTVPAGRFQGPYETVEKPAFERLMENVQMQGFRNPEE
jgi:hypothetical protein